LLFGSKGAGLILAEKLFTLPAANEMLSQSALFAGKSRVGKAPLTGLGSVVDLCKQGKARFQNSDG
jgi:hypothetical protein